MDFKKVARAAAIITFETKDARRYFDKCEDFGLEEVWIGKNWKNKITNFEFELCGLRQRNTNWMLIVKDIKNSTDKNKIYMLVSLKEFFDNCELI